MEYDISMTSTIFLIRHGEAAASWGEAEDPGLSENGREQAACAADKLSALLRADTTVLSSPLLRAQQTAEPVAKALGASIQIEDTFREIPTPASLADRQVWLREFMRQTWESQQEPLLTWRRNAIDRLMQLEGCTVIYTHFMILNVVVGHLQDRPDTVCFMPDNASITELQLDAGSLRLIRQGHEMTTVVN